MKEKTLSQYQQLKKYRSCDLIVRYLYVTDISGEKIQVHDTKKRIPIYKSYFKYIKEGMFLNDVIMNYFMKQLKIETPNSTFHL